MTDVRVRRAVYMAINKRAIKDQIYAGYARLARGNVVPPLVLGFNPKIDDYPYDVSRARELVSDAGATGKSVSFVCTNQTFLNVVETCQVITASLQQIGLNVSLATPPFAQWLEQYRNGPAGRNRPDILFGTPGDETLDMANKVAPTYFRSWKDGGGGAVIEDPQLASMVAAAQGEADKAKREAIERAMSKRVRDMAYIVPLFVPHNLWAMARNVNFKPLANRSLFLSDVRFAS
jgi:peptide/nickel transport system substrate-binding protein